MATPHSGLVRQEPQPKELLVLDGLAHAQFRFRTGQADRVMKGVLRFLFAST